jgi:hypothetical protein
MSDVDQGPSDDELFDEAVSDETPDNPVVAEQVEQPVRDEAGRFAKKEEPETAEVITETQVEKPAVDDNAPMVPSWRVREINDEKRTLADRLAALEAEKATWQRQPQQPQQQPRAVEPPKVVVPDPLLDPEGYREHVLEEARQERLRERRDESMEKAHEANPEEFAAAYKAATENGVIPELKARMNNSRDPGKELLAWHREQKVKAEVGTDPTAWLEKKLEERLNDPAFLQKAIERSKGASQQSDGRPRVDLPPSLNGASRSNASLKSSNDDVSDDELFREVAG